MYKCSCAIDAIADKVSYSTWVDLSTVANGITIAGERGGVMRDMKDGRKLIASFRELAGQRQEGLFHQERIDEQARRADFRRAAAAHASVAARTCPFLAPRSRSRTLPRATGYRRFPMENPAPGIYVHYGQQAEMTPDEFRRRRQPWVCGWCPLRRGHRYRRNIRCRSRVAAGDPARDTGAGVLCHQHACPSGPCFRQRSVRRRSSRIHRPCAPRRCDAAPRPELPQRAAAGAWLTSRYRARSSCRRARSHPPKRSTWAGES